MSKIIVALEQIDEGAINPGTGMYEQPIWKITLKGQEERLLGKHKMEEYISKSFGSACASSSRTVTSLSRIAGIKTCSKNCSALRMVEQLISTNGFFRDLAKDFANSVFPNPFAPLKRRKGSVPVAFIASL